MTSWLSEAIHNDDQAEDRQMHLGCRSHVRTDAEFRAAVQVGIDSASIGPNRALEIVAAEIRRSLIAPAGRIPNTRELAITGLPYTAVYRLE